MHGLNFGTSMIGLLPTFFSWPNLWFTDDSFPWEKIDMEVHLSDYGALENWVDEVELQLDAQMAH